MAEGAGQVNRCVIVAAAVLTLAGCAQQLQIPQRVYVPTAAACVDQETAAKLEAACPKLRSDAELAELDDYKFVKALLADRGKAADLGFKPNRITRVE